MAIGDCDATTRAHLAPHSYAVATPAKALSHSSIRAASIRQGRPPSTIEAFGMADIKKWVTALSAGDARVRKDAALSLGALSDKRAVAPLIGALRDPDSGVRRAAALSLGVLRAKGAAGVIAGVLLSDPDWSARRMAAFTLGVLGDTALVGSLAKALRDPSAKVRGAACRALGQIGDKEAVAALGELRIDPEIAVRFDAAAAVLKLNEVKGRPLMQRLLDEGRLPERLQKTGRSLLKARRESGRRTGVAGGK